MATPQSNNANTNADHNRMMRLNILRAWDKLLAKAGNPTAKGTMAIEIPYGNGRLGEPRITHVRYGFEE